MFFHIEYISSKIAIGIGVNIKSCKISFAVTLLSLYTSLTMAYLSDCIHVQVTSYDTHLNTCCHCKTQLFELLCHPEPRLTPCMLTSISCLIKTVTCKQWSCPCINSVMACSQKWLSVCLPFYAFNPQTLVKVCERYPN